MNGLKLSTLFPRINIFQVVKLLMLLKGFESVKTEFDIICKFDADLIFEKNYLSTITKH